jgi:hypothetical protein
MRDGEIGLPSGSLQSKSHIAPSCGTSCLRSKKRIVSIVSTNGLRPPCTHNTAPLRPGPPAELPQSAEAPVPGAPPPPLPPPPAPVRGNCRVTPGEAFEKTSSIPSRSPVCRCRTSRLISSPLALSNSISMSSSSVGIVPADEGSASGGGSGNGCTDDAAPVTRAPRAK